MESDFPLFVPDHILGLGFVRALYQGVFPFLFAYRVNPIMAQNSAT